MSAVALTQDDPGYPKELLLVESPPKVLYAEGDLSLLDRPRVSIIGSRDPTPYGYRIAHLAAKQLAERGVVIVSGLARGLDARAHRGALDAKGGTIAVLGNGLDVHYPLQNRDLQEEIRATGLLLTEKTAGTRPKSWYFPARNRIIAGLGRCLLVVEGRIKGGTSNTTDFALRSEVTVFAVPGHIDEELAKGPNTLIKQGAKIYTGPNDILEPLGLPLIPDAHETKTSRFILAAEARAQLSHAEATLFDLIDHAPVHVDILATKAAVEPGLLLAALSSLELQGLITQLPGKHFKLAA